MNHNKLTCYDGETMEGDYKGIVIVGLRDDNYVECTCITDKQGKDHEQEMQFDAFYKWKMIKAMKSLMFKMIDSNKLLQVVFEVDPTLFNANSEDHIISKEEFDLRQAIRRILKEDEK